MHNQSREHIVLEGALHTLCGVEPRWLYENAGASGFQCSRCFQCAARRGMVDEHGMVFVA